MLCADHAVLPRAVSAPAVSSFCLDALQTVPLQVAVENQPNDFSLLRDDLRLAVCSFSVADDSAVREGKFAVLISHALTAGNILGDRFALGLRKGAQHSEDHLGVHGGGVDILFFKVDSNANLLQLSDGLDAFHRISCNLVMDFVRIRSMFPSSQSAIIIWNSSLCFTFVPLIPSSAYTPANSHRGLLSIFSV